MNKKYKKIFKLVGGTSLLFAVFFFFGINVSKAVVTKLGPTIENVNYSSKWIGIGSSSESSVSTIYSFCAFAQNSTRTPVSGWLTCSDTNCSGHPELVGFCNAMKQCYGSDIFDACHRGVADYYNDKYEQAAEDETNSLAEQYGLDSSKVSSATSSCNGDLNCITTMINLIKEDEEYSDGASTGSSSDSLTISSLTSLINSYTNNSGTGASNSSENDPGGLYSSMSGPKVEVKFSSTGGVAYGSKITATAFPSYFNNDSDASKLYFTWYLKRKDCKLTDNNHPTGWKRDGSDNWQQIAEDNDSGKLNSCDHDFDKRITVNDWKIAAAKITLNKSYDNTSADYSKSIDSKAAGYRAVPEIDKEENNANSSTLNQGWINGFLRNGNGDLYQDNGLSEDIANCYVQAPKSGLTYELRKAKQVIDINKVCPSGYHQACIKDQNATCEIYNSEDKTTSACVVSSENKSIENWDYNNAFCSVSDADLTKYEALVSCRDGYSICVPDDKNLEVRDNAQKFLGAIIAKTPTETLNDRMCKAVLGNDPTHSTYFSSTPRVSAEDEKCSVLQDELINGKKNGNNTIVSGNIKLKPECDFVKGENLCKHLFPILPKSVTFENGKRLDLKTDQGNQAVTGDGEFNIAEKEFWDADPTTPTTNGKIKDEEVLVGLGQDKFDWMYVPGDQIGVVVEGENIVKNEKGTYKRMWAFSKDTCVALEKMESNSSIDPEDPGNNIRGFYMNGKMGILTTDVDLNECLLDNLIDPEVEDTASSAAQLTAFPENPVNDENGQGDLLTISSVVAISQGALSTSVDGPPLIYNWSVLQSRDGTSPPIDTTKWIDITTDLEEIGALSADARSGLGKKELEINLNIPESFIKSNFANSKSYDGAFYLKIKVKATNTQNSNQDASGEIVVNVRQQKNKMVAYPVTVADDGTLSMNKGISGQSTAVCGEEESMSECYVSNNTILAFEIPNVANSQISNVGWKLNGKQFSCSSQISPDCTTNSNIVFAPILGNEGEAVDVTANALNEKGESFSLNRRFIIAKNKLEIQVEDQTYCGIDCLNSNNICPKYLGKYTSASGGENNCSNEIWRAKKGSLVTLSVQGQKNFEWTVDGQVVDEAQDKNKVKLSIEKASGQIYDVGVTSRLTELNKKQARNIKQALSKNWGISYNDIEEETQIANMQIDVVSSSGSLAATKQGFFGASLITHLPEQLMFLFKILLTAATLLLTSGLLFAVIPESPLKARE